MVQPLQAAAPEEVELGKPLARQGLEAMEALRLVVRQDHVSSVQVAAGVRKVRGGCGRVAARCAQGVPGGASGSCLKARVAHYPFFFLPPPHPTHTSPPPNHAAADAAAAGTPGSGSLALLPGSQPLGAAAGDRRGGGAAVSDSAHVPVCGLWSVCRLVWPFSGCFYKRGRTEGCRGDEEEPPGRETLGGIGGAKGWKDEAAGS